MDNDINRLFVYGIFLDAHNRLAYGMSNPCYTTVNGWATVGSGIVQAVKAPYEYALTGLIVDVDPTQWESLDRLEGGYQRILVTTVDNEWAYMYAERSS
jgi:gamma-glutamylcyclotransferase (GGCT)/AIG2-like uncharacterized protein YtfP